MTIEACCITLDPPSISKVPPMTLALVALSQSDFDIIYDHVAAHNPRYANMHLREAGVRNGIRGQRYLHAVHVHSGHPRTLEGKLSGPGVFAHYQIVSTSAGLQLNVLYQGGEPREIRRLPKRFIPELLGRVAQEQAGGSLYTNYSPREYYLRRSGSGRPPKDPLCVKAGASGQLDQRFVDVLSAWSFGLPLG